jgi:hypothetical protein
LEGEECSPEAIDHFNDAAAINAHKADVFFELAGLHMDAAFGRAASYFQ